MTQSLLDVRNVTKTFGGGFLQRAAPTVALDHFTLTLPAEARRLIGAALEFVGLRVSETLGKYPHQLSGGQRQRLMIARAFLLKPRVIVADEPVSMVDASIRSMILDLMVQLKREVGVSF